LKRVFVGLVRDHKTRIGFIRAVTRVGRESNAENKDRDQGS
jgi:hypothetical protein